MLRRLTASTSRGTKEEHVPTRTRIYIHTHIYIIHTPTPTHTYLPTSVSSSSVNLARLCCTLVWYLALSSSVLVSPVLDLVSLSVGSLGNEFVLFCFWVWILALWGATVVCQ